ncbi:hypothetical protein JXA56_02645 [Candidatus Micrarchaeota archaeon]|nr:hypothetical protein [Candidatus Micrarchaeota archaeon]
MKRLHARILPEPELRLVKRDSMARAGPIIEPIPEPVIRELRDGNIGDVMAVWYSISESDSKKNYADANGQFSALSYGAGVVRDFCDELAGLTEERNFRQKAGALLSALINNCTDRTITLEVDHLKGTELLFYRNNKNLNIITNVHSDAGERNSGRIFISGSVHGNVGKQNMKGEINIEGNVYGKVSEQQEGGEINVFGSVGDSHLVTWENGRGAIFGAADSAIGTGMKGGYVEIHGEAGLVGICQFGGTIKVKRAGSLIGIRKKGGTIEITDSCDSIGPDVSGGQIIMRGKQIYPYKSDIRSLALMDLVRAWETFDMKDVESGYERACRIAKELRYDCTGVRRFADMLGVFEHENNFSRKAGIFLSALVNMGDQKYYTIDLTKLTVKPSLIGYRNTKRLRVLGNVGPHAAKEQLGSTIIIEGSAGYGFAAWKKGGNALVTEGAGDFAGMGMSGGKIVIYNGAGKECGHNFAGGEIKVGGTVESWGSIQNAQLVQGSG